MICSMFIIWINSQNLTVISLFILRAVRNVRRKRNGFISGCFRTVLRRSLKPEACARGRKAACSAAGVNKRRTHSGFELLPTVRKWVFRNLGGRKSMKLLVNKDLSCFKLWITLCLHLRHFCSCLAGGKPADKLLVLMG